MGMDEEEMFFLKLNARREVSIVCVDVCVGSWRDRILGLWQTL